MVLTLSNLKRYPWYSLVILVNLALFISAFIHTYQEGAQRFDGALIRVVLYLALLVGAISLINFGVLIVQVMRRNIASILVVLMLMIVSIGSLAMAFVVDKLGLLG